MKVGIIHLSDFHITDNRLFVKAKIDGISRAISQFNDVDEIILVFSGDLTFSGHIAEFAAAKSLIGDLISGIKEKAKPKKTYIRFIDVPGNHDMCIPEEARTGKDIQDYYTNNSIEEKIKTEHKYLHSFYTIQHRDAIYPNECIVRNYYINEDGFIIQFNLINTAPFSTLLPDDKELHFISESDMQKLEKRADSDYCITIMHHSYDWFYWKCKDRLEECVIKESDLLLYGHDHCDHEKNISIDNSEYLWVSAAGKMDFYSVNGNQDSFKYIIIDTSSKSFDAYDFRWNEKESFFVKASQVCDKAIAYHYNLLRPSGTFLSEFRQDSFSKNKDYEDCFVFPKLVVEGNYDIPKYGTISDNDTFRKVVLKKKSIIITGSTNSGKTTLLKNLYCSLIGEKVPLFYSTRPKSSLSLKKFIKQLFEEQYGEDVVLFEKYLQLEKEKKVLIIDQWDEITSKDSIALLKELVSSTFGIVILSVSNGQTDVVDQIKLSLQDSKTFTTYHIKPFYKEKRNELVEKICRQHDICDQNEIGHINSLVDIIVHNNTNIFLLNPVFIKKYVNYFLENPFKDYSNGELVFSKVFEYEITKEIASQLDGIDIDEYIVAFEEIFGYMFSNKKTVISDAELKTIIDSYNSKYGENVKIKHIIDVGINTSLLLQDDYLNITYGNRNYFSYFIAKYLIRRSQSIDNDNEGIIYAIDNICFGINSDIILFISLILDNILLLNLILTATANLFSGWECITIDNSNISFLKDDIDRKVKMPSESETKKFEKEQERIEEYNYSEKVVQTKDIFDYNEEDIKILSNKINCAIKYTDFISKALLSFHSIIPLEMKKKLVTKIYKYPRQIIYALLKPLDDKKEIICDDCIAYANKKGIKKKNGEGYQIEDIHEMLKNTSIALMLSLFDHYAEISTSPKTIDILSEHDIEDFSDSLVRLLIIENGGNTDKLIKESAELLKKYKNRSLQYMVKLVMRKHLLVNKNIPFNKKQKAADLIFGKNARKNALY